MCSIIKFLKTVPKVNAIVTDWALLELWEQWSDEDYDDWYQYLDSYLDITVTDHLVDVVGVPEGLEEYMDIPRYVRDKWDWKERNEIVVYEPVGGVAVVADELLLERWAENPKKYITGDFYVICLDKIAKDMLEARRQYDEEGEEEKLAEESLRKLLESGNEDEDEDEKNVTKILLSHVIHRIVEGDGVVTK
jgi:hypothetical protein